MSFIYKCGKLVPVETCNCNISWKVILLCSSTGVILVGILKALQSRKGLNDIEESIKSLRSDLRKISDKIDRVETLLRAVSDTATDTSDLDHFNTVRELYSKLESSPKPPLTLEATPHYKATTDISGKIIKKIKDVSN